MQQAQTRPQPITPDQIFGIVLKRRWIILVPFALAILVGIYLALVLPKTYGAETLILVQAQEVPNDYVQSVVSSDINARISTISQQILSRTNLEKIIGEFGLFQGNNNKNMFVEDQIADLRQRIVVKITNARDQRRDADAFNISFKDSDPEKVMKITNALATYFIDENLKVRENQAIGTSNFIEEEMFSTRTQLTEMENLLKEYRQRYMGELPEQLETNLRLLDRLQEQLTSKQEGLRDTKNRIIVFEQMQANRRPASPVTSQSPGQPAVSQREKLEKELEELEARYTGKHPDIVRLKKVIADLDAESAAAPPVKKPPVRTSASPPMNHLSQMERQQYLQDKNDLATTQLEIEGITKQIAVLEKRIENTPNREQELLSIQRDYDNLKASYSSLLNRKLEAQLSVNMEKKQKGEQFRVIDPARYPTKPLEPNLPRLFLMVIAIGLGLGGGIVFLIEFMDSSFRKPEDIEEFLGIPVVARIANLYDPRRHKRNRLNTVMSLAILILTLGLLGIYAAITFIGTTESIAIVRKLTIF